MQGLLIWPGYFPTYDIAIRIDYRPCSGSLRCIHSLIEITLDRCDQAAVCAESVTLAYYLWRERQSIIREIQ